MSKRGATDQGGKDTGYVYLNEDRSAERAERASTDVMSRRKTAVPKSRRKPGAPGVEALGNIFGSNPTPAFGAPQPSTQNSQSNNIFGGLTSFQPQTQSAPVSTPTNGAPSLFGNISQAPTASAPSKNIFGSGASTGFSFGADNSSFNNPFAQHTADQVQNSNNLFATPTMSTPFKGVDAPKTEGQGFGTPEKTPNSSQFGSSLFGSRTPADEVQDNNNLFANPTKSTPLQGVGAPKTESPGFGTPKTPNSSLFGSSLFGSRTPNSLNSPADFSMQSAPNSAQSQAMARNGGTPSANEAGAAPSTSPSQPADVSMHSPASSVQSQTMANNGVTPSANESGALASTSTSQPASTPGTSITPAPGPGRETGRTGLPPNSKQSPRKETLEDFLRAARTPPTTQIGYVSEPYAPKSSVSQATAPSTSADTSSLFAPKSNDSQAARPTNPWGSSSLFPPQPSDSQASAQSTPAKSSSLFAPKSNDSQAPPSTNPWGSSSLFPPKPSDSQAAAQSTAAKTSGLFPSSASSFGSFSQNGSTSTFGSSSAGFGSSSKAFDSSTKAFGMPNEGSGTPTGGSGVPAVRTGSFQDFPTGFGSQTSSNEAQSRPSSTNNTNTNYRKPAVANESEERASSFNNAASKSSEPSTTLSGPHPNAFGGFGKPPAEASASTNQSGNAFGTSPATASEAAAPTWAEANMAAEDAAAPGAFMVAAQFLNAQGTLEELMLAHGVTFSTEEKHKFLMALQMRFITRSFQECVSKANPSDDLSSICRAYIAQTDEIKAGVYFNLPALKRKASESVDETRTKAPRLGSGSSGRARSNTASMVQDIVDGPSPSSGGHATTSGASITPQMPTNEQSLDSSAAPPQKAPAKHTFGSVSTFGAKSTGPFGQSAAADAAPPQSSSSKPSGFTPSGFTPSGFTPSGGMAASGASSFAAQFGQQAKQNGEEALAKAKAKRKAEEFDSDEDNEEEWEKKDKERQSKYARKQTTFGKQGFGFEKSTETAANTAAPSLFGTPPTPNNIFANVSPKPSEMVDQPSSDEDEEDPPQPEATKPDAPQPETPSSGAGRSLFDRITYAKPAAGEKDATETQTTGHSLFGATTTGTSKSLFGATTTGTSKSLFGAPSISTSKSLFGTETSDSSTSPNVFAKFSQNPEDTASGVDTSPGDHTWKGDSDSPIKFGTAGKPVNGAGANGADGEQSATPSENSSSRPFAGLSSASTASAPKPSLFGLDGASDEVPTPGEKTPTPSLIGKATPSSGSLFSPKAGPASVAGSLASVSRASTPAELSDATSVAASEDEGEGTDSQSDMTALSAAERRQEEVLFEVKAKLMQHSKEDKKEPIKTVGTGPLRVLKNRETQAVRMLMRCAPRGQVVLNATLQAGMAFKKKQKSTLQFGAPDPTGSFQMWFVRTGLDSKADELVAMLEQQTPKA